mgnify:CR=1 FL=1
MYGIICFICTFNYALAALLSNWGSFVGIDYAIEAGSGTGLASVASIKTLDTGMVGALNCCWCCSMVA